MSELFLLDLQLEPMEQRYSTQWSRWFKDAYHRNNIPFLSIDGFEFKNDIPLRPGEFLDCFSTFRWKFNQLKNTIDRLEFEQDRNNNIVIFLADGWYPGIECLPYIAKMRGINIRICSFWHAGSYDSTDLLGQLGFHGWARGSEQTWFKLNNKIFVGSNYHREKLLAALGTKDTDAEKVIVTGLPIEVPKLDLTQKENIVVWPHRISSDKQPEIFDKLSQEPRFQNIQFVKTKELNLDKQEYYKLLAKSKVVVSTALHENFGISIVESALLGCWPVVPNRLAYKETIPKYCRYNDYQEMVEKVELCLGCAPFQYPASYQIDYFQENVTDNICNEIKDIYG